MGTLDSSGLSDAGMKRIRDALGSYEDGVYDALDHLLAELHTCSAELAKDEHYRRNIGIENAGLWKLIQGLWRLTSTEISDVDDINLRHTELCINVARFTRNIVAGVSANQEQAFENEGAIRSLVNFYTSYSAIQDSATYPAARMLVQTLSNMVTGNDALMARLWKTYMTLPEEQLILLRLLTSPDAKTVSSTFVLVLNCLHSSSERMEGLITAPRGPRLTITMLDRISALAESEAEDENHVFDIGFELFTNVIEAGLTPALYKTIHMPGEPITPPQTTLLKLLDSYLHKSSRGLQVKARNDALVHMLVDTLLDLAAYARDAIRRALGSADDLQGPSGSGQQVEERQPPSGVGSESTPPPPKELDLLLPKVSEALVLVTQCLTTLTLTSTEQPHNAGNSGKVKAMLAEACSADGEGLVEVLVETLRLLDTFLPRITFGKVVERPSPPGVRSPPADAAPHPHSGIKGFSYVKRDLVRLLGIIALDDRGVQDRVRECGGIPVVMNLCVVDDRNPYMKEHAILALRNLLHGNKANQDVVREIQPVARWDERGILQTLL
ncbi:hypothetical protein DAEQUDRAFT_734174 [Daedalea quercina L-15889]|uniref:Ataxin-10 homolog n=1 Tax=Daedalea quercina L-15889 TaxID=1314783 RepID=A0A165KH77_9APHY|nr:hypothetical protein DAEQUDRAFT_734174 [Daedalea quercina L-15889]